MKPFKDWVLGVDFVYPLLHFNITDTFRMPSRPTHMGVDLCATVGDAVLNMFFGKVNAIYPSAAPGGTTVEIANSDENTIATYSHLDDVRVRKGDTATMGEVIGTIADLPRPHCHLQLRAWIDAEVTLRLPKTV
jgi:murein DD-endopeptidase MepM/ murein hydrolase activator NlpD